MSSSLGFFLRTLGSHRELEAGRRTGLGLCFRKSPQNGWGQGSGGRRRLSQGRGGGDEGQTGLEQSEAGTVWRPGRLTGYGDEGDGCGPRPDSLRLRWRPGK